VELLLEKGAEPDSKDEDGWTPLSWATLNGHEVVVELLLEKGAEPDSRDKWGRTPLSWATENRHEAVVKLLESTVPMIPKVVLPTTPAQRPP
jgi:ankyrin repeat protein